MKLTCIYDTLGKDGEDNKKAWQALPAFARLLIKQSQYKIAEMLQQQNPGREFIKTSGFRSPAVSIRWGGSIHSLHHLGYAIDIFKQFGDVEPRVADGFVCIVEQSHYHIAYKRGV